MRAAVYKRPLYIKRGDSFQSPVFRLHSLVAHGGPVDFTNSTLAARMVRASGTAIPVQFEVEPVDLAARRIRLKLTAEQTRTIPFSHGIWEIEVHDNATDWEGTPLEGTADIPGEIQP